MIKVKCKYIFTENVACHYFHVKLKIYYNNKIFPIRLDKTIVSTWWEEYHGKDNYNKFLETIKKCLDDNDTRKEVIRLIVKKEFINRDIDIKNTNSKNSILKKIKSINSKECEEYTFQYEELMSNKKQLI